MLFDDPCRECRFVHGLLRRRELARYRHAAGLISRRLRRAWRHDGCSFGPVDGRFLDTQLGAALADPGRNLRHAGTRRTRCWLGRCELGGRGGIRHRNGQTGDTEEGARNQKRFKHRWTLHAGSSGAGETLGCRSIDPAIGAYSGAAGHFCVVLWVAAVRRPCVNVHDEDSAREWSTLARDEHPCCLGLALVFTMYIQQQLWVRRLSSVWHNAQSLPRCGCSPYSVAGWTVIFDMKTRP